jgi:hypothetical protein
MMWGEAKAIQVCKDLFSKHGGVFNHDPKLLAAGLFGRMKSQARGRLTQRVITEMQKEGLIEVNYYPARYEVRLTPYGERTAIVNMENDGEFDDYVPVAEGGDEA